MFIKLQLKRIQTMVTKFFKFVILFLPWEYVNNILDINNHIIKDTIRMSVWL